MYKVKSIYSGSSGFRAELEDGTIFDDPKKFEAWKEEEFKKEHNSTNAMYAIAAALERIADVLDYNGSGG